MVGFRASGSRFQVRGGALIIERASSNAANFVPWNLEPGTRNPEPGAIMLSDLDYMNRALDLAERGRGTTSPNPMVGAVVVRKTAQSSGRGITNAPEDLTPKCARLRKRVIWRAEPLSIARWSRAVMWVAPGRAWNGSWLPGSARVIAPSVDADPRVSGQGFDFLRRKGIDVSVGTGRDRALRLNRAYFTFKTRRRPFVIMKAATSLDNRLTAREGEGTPVTSEDSRRHAHAVRAEVDAIAVGSGTLLVDDPLLTARHVHRRPSAYAGIVRPAPAGSAFGEGVLDPRGRAGDNRHHTRRDGQPSRTRQGFGAGGR